MVAIRPALVALMLLFVEIETPVANAQSFYRWTEFGISVGGTQYFGDLNDQYGFNNVRPAFGVWTRFHLTPYIALRASINGTQVGYDDLYSDNPYHRARNLRFTSNIYEGVVQAEFNFFRFATGDDRARFTPYLTFGAGAFHYDPYAFYTGRRFYLREQGTEGQNSGFTERRYHKIAACFPVGAGFKYWIRPGMNLSFEVADRLTLTDYLDDVSTTYVGADRFPTDPAYPNAAGYLQDPSGSLGVAGKQRGNSQTKDQYLMGIISLSLQFKTYRCPGYMRDDYLQ